MTIIDLHSAAPARSGLFQALLRLPHLIALQRARRELAEMDENRLRDIGLTPDAARAEAARSFWDAPQHWMR